MRDQDKPFTVRELLDILNLLPDDLEVWFGEGRLEGIRAAFVAEVADSPTNSRGACNIGFVGKHYWNYSQGGVEKNGLIESHPRTAVVLSYNEQAK